MNTFLYTKSGDSNQPPRTIVEFGRRKKIPGGAKYKLKFANPESTGAGKEIGQVAQVGGFWEYSIDYAVRGKEIKLADALKSLAKLAGVESDTLKAQFENTKAI